MNYAAYKSGYKYHLAETYTLTVAIKADAAIDIDYVSLDLNGQLVIKKGYAWDGPSGPTIDTLSFMRGSLVHDALYQLMRERLLDPVIHREAADDLLRAICLEDGMLAIRAWWVHLGVRWFAKAATDPANQHPTIFAPRPPEQIRLGANIRA